MLKQNIKFKWNRILKIFKIISSSNPRKNKIEALQKILFLKKMTPKKMNLN